MIFEHLKAKIFLFLVNISAFLIYKDSRKRKIILSKYFGYNVWHLCCDFLENLSFKIEIHNCAWINIASFIILPELFHCIYQKKSLFRFFNFSKLRAYFVFWSVWIWINVVNPFLYSFQLIIIIWICFIFFLNDKTIIANVKVILVWQFLILKFQNFIF